MGYTAAQMVSTNSIKAASSTNSKDTASDLPASEAAEVAFICEPFLNLRFNLLFSSASI